MDTDTDGLPLLAVYRSGEQLFASGAVDPLLESTIRGFCDLASKSYDDSIECIRFGPYVVSVRTEAALLLFCVDRQPRELAGLSGSIVGRLERGEDVSRAVREWLS